MAETLSSAIQRAAEQEVLANPPETQEEICLLAARLGFPLLGVPKDFAEAGRQLASGLFGEAYRNATKKRRIAWDRMCEAALREVAGTHH